MRVRPMRVWPMRVWPMRVRPMPGTADAGAGDAGPPPRFVLLDGGAIDGLVAARYEHRPGRLVRRGPPPVAVLVARGDQAVDRPAIEQHEARRRAGVSRARIGRARIGRTRIGRTRIGRARIGRTRIGRTRIGRTRIGRTRIGRTRIGRARVRAAIGRRLPRATGQGEEAEHDERAAHRGDATTQAGNSCRRSRRP